MPQDAFTLRLSALELNKLLTGGKISKIVQPSREEVVFYIYTQKTTSKLVLNVNASDCGVYFTDEAVEAPLVAPNFCMLLRKHLHNAEILNVSLVGFERIVKIELLCRSDFSDCTRELYIEVMGKYSNVILTEKGAIMGALKTTSLDLNAKRMIFTGMNYVLPEKQDKADPSDRDALAAALVNPLPDLGKMLFERVAGLAPCTAEEIARSYRGGDLAAHVHTYVFSDEISPRVGERDFYARGGTGERFETLSEAQTFFYDTRKRKKRLEAKRKSLHTVCANARKKHEKRLAQTLEKIEACKDCELLRIKGELLTANLYKIERGMKGVELENYYDGSTLKITLDPALSPAQNAQAYYKRYRKQKRTEEFLLPQADETRRELDYIAGLLTAIETAADESDLTSLEEELLAAGLLAQPKEKKKKAEEIGFRIYEKDGFTVLAGRNNLQNERLVRASSPDDLWLHTQKYHSCHVVIKTEERTVPDGVLLFAAQICARYSGAGGGKIPVDYCKIKFVKKPPKSKPGFVIYTDYKTVLVETE